MDFSTTVSSEYKWPFPKPITAKPSLPPTGNTTPYPHPPPVAPYCHCDGHKYLPLMAQYKLLLEKEKKLCEDYENLKKTIVNVNTDMQENPSDDIGPKNASMYQSSYKKRSFPITDYRAIVSSASQNKTPIPMEAKKLGQMLCYKDPTFFTMPPPTSRPSIFKVKKIKHVFPPIPYPGHTEYQDTYDIVSVVCTATMQRNKYPMPSCRRPAPPVCLS